MTNSPRSIERKPHDRDHHRRNADPQSGCALFLEGGASIRVNIRAVWLYRSPRRTAKAAQPLSRQGHDPPAGIGSIYAVARSWRLVCLSPSLLLTTWGPLGFEIAPGCIA